MRWRERFTEEEVRAAVAASRTYSEVLRRLGLRAAGSNFRTLKRYIARTGNIPTDHFDPRLVVRVRKPAPLHTILVPGSTYHRGHLKRRLLEEGLKQPACELCGQGPIWHGRQMSLVLDHANGVHDDNRLENLRILCPNCNATLDTHCGKHNKRKHPDRLCAVCERLFRPHRGGQLYCSQSCAGQGEARRAAQRTRRTVERPPYEQLLAEIEASSFLAVGRRYGVSDNAIRKWVRTYEAEERRDAERV
jgi:hypothetical protein